MKVGVLTFHRAYNYGAVLQAYALQKKLGEIGVQCEVIDYLSREKRAQTKLFSYNKKLSIKGNLSKFIKDFYRVEKNAAFDRFMAEEMHISSNSYSKFEELVQMDKNAPYDVYIVGSDQVWNYKNTMSDPAFLLSFVSEDMKKCSYAASFGSADLDKELYALYKTELGKFRVLTVREESAITKFDFLEEKNAKVVLDPTLLLSKETYMKIANPRILEKKYVFVYTIAEERNLRKIAADYCRANGLVLVDCKKSGVFFKNSSPRDFLSFIQHAESVFTNSFHGTAFSIVLEKPFYTEVHTRTSLNNRSNDLLNKLDLSDRDIDSDSFSLEKLIDYSEVNQKLKEMRSDSIGALKMIVGMKEMYE